MDEDILKKIIEGITSNLTEKGTHIEWSDERYKPHIINKNNFHKITDISSDKKIAFIDGGNSEIIKTASFSLNFIRIYYTIYKNNKRIHRKKYESYVLANTKKINNNISFKASIYGDIKLNKDDLIFDSFDETIRQGINRANISRIGEIARRFAEIKIAENIIEHLNPKDYIIRDGSLQCTITNESKYLNSLYKKAEEKDIIICALSKTNTLITETGYPITALLEELSPEHSWYYYPIASISNPDHMAELFFTKLHRKSKHIFRFEVFNKNKFNKEEIFSLLKQNSQDPVFLGYPYGLIEADKFARASNSETEYLRTKIMSKSGKNWSKLNKHFTTTNAHDILDNIG